MNPNRDAWAHVFVFIWFVISQNCLTFSLTGWELSAISWVLFYSHLLWGFSEPAQITLWPPAFPGDHLGCPEIDGGKPSSMSWVSLAVSSTFYRTPTAWPPKKHQWQERPLFNRKKPWAKIMWVTLVLMESQVIGGEPHLQLSWRTWVKIKSV